MSERLLLIGGGGHGRVVLETLLQRYAPAELGIIDPQLSRGAALLGVPVLGGDDDLPALYALGWRSAVLGVGSIQSSAAREKLAQLARGIGFQFPAVVDEYALVSPSAVLGEGSYVGKRAVVQAGARIGAFCIVNTGSIVEHDCRVGDFAHISTGAILLGGATVGDRSFVGGGSVVRQLETVGAHTVIGAGSVVVAAVADGVTAYGNPCRVGGKK